MKYSPNKEDKFPERQKTRPYKKRTNKKISESLKKSWDRKRQAMMAGKETVLPPPSSPNGFINLKIPAGESRVVVMTPDGFVFEVIRK